jgi:hypothetical protein
MGAGHGANHGDDSGMNDRDDDDDDDDDDENYENYDDDDSEDDDDDEADAGDGDVIAPRHVLRVRTLRPASRTMRAASRR